MKKPIGRSRLSRTTSREARSRSFALSPVVPLTTNENTIVDTINEIVSCWILSPTLTTGHTRRSLSSLSHSLSRHTTLPNTHDKSHKFARFTENTSQQKKTGFTLAKKAPRSIHPATSELCSRMYQPRSRDETDPLSRPECIQIYPG